MSEKSILTERSVLTEILKMYRELPCLWDVGYQLYNNKEARDNAHQLLLEKYRLIQDDANIESIKKKLENMRCCYKREHKKVLVSMANGEKIYKPTLWYYKYLTFLDDFNEKSDESGEETEFKQDFSYEERPAKKVKLSSIFLTEEDHLSHVMNNEISVQDGDLAERNSILQNEAESFGRTIGLQLNLLSPSQKFIAEKLISDVIFYGRFDKLNFESSVTLKKTFSND